MASSHSTPRERIVIVGGGIAALTAAHHLSRTPEARARYEVTVYQLGWRLGGKLASGRNPDKGWRNEEHGLHVWFGFYDNAFALKREVFERWAAPPGCPFVTWRDAFTPQSLTPIGECDSGGRWGTWPLNWPRNLDEPGDGRLELSLFGVVSQLLGGIEALFETLRDEARIEPAPGFDLVPDGLEDVLRWARERLAALWPRRPDASAVPGLLAHAHALIDALDLSGPDADGNGVPDTVDRLAEVVRELLADFQRALHVVLRGVHPLELATGRNVACALDLGLAMVRGMLDPAYGILADGNLDRIDHLEFRDWLVAGGANPDIVAKWSGVRALYDMAFQYTDGDTTKPSFAAGAATRVIVRIMTQYKGTCLYLLRSGMGETLIAPLYEVLRDQGVRFRFFHKLVGTTLSDDGNVLTGLRFARQVELTGGPDAEYQPLTTVRGLRCWGHQPDWTQIEDGDALRDAGVNLESHWAKHAPAGHVELVHGVDFDRCVLGVSLGAFKVLNDTDVSLAAPLIERKPAFREMTEQLPLIPSCGLQLWMDRSLEALGWDVGSPAMVAWAYPMDIWADMTPVIATEDWPPEAGGAPKTSHYLCGAFGTELYKRPAHAHDTPHEAEALLFEQVCAQFDSSGGMLWPGAAPHGQPDALDWRVLHAPPSETGRDRLRWQYLRANIEPTECCVGTPPDSVRYRIEPDQTGVINLLVCGAWTRTGINASCVESAVMSGMKAARALTGEPLRVVGEDFLGPPVRRRGTARQPPRSAPAVADASPGPAPSTPEPGLTRRAMRHELPPYQDTLGHGQQSVLPPGVVKDNRVYVFAVRIDAQRAEDFVAQRLAGPTLGALEYKVLGDVMLVSFLDGGELTSTAVEMGWLRDRECALTLLMAEKRRDRDEPKLVGWMPYLFVDTSIAMCTGREIWGFPKEMGQVIVPPRSGPFDRFQASCRHFATLDAGCEGVVAPIVTVRREAGTGAVASTFETLEDVTTWLVEQLTDEHDQLWHWNDAVELALDAAGLALARRARVVNLKQFRDAEFPDRACYQAIVHSEFEFAELRGGAVLAGDYRIEIAKAQSHRIVSDLGLPGHDLDVMFGFYVDIDFRIPAGKTVWKAP